MLGTVLCYLGATGLVGAAAFGLYYLFDERGAKGFLAKASWYGMRTYIQVNEYITEPDKNSDADDADDDFDEGYEQDNEIGDEQVENKETQNSILKKNLDKYIHYTIEPEEIIKSYANEEVRQDIKNEHQTDLELVLTKINNDKYYKIIDSDDVLPIKEYLPIEKCFIQVELEQNNEKICIHEYLDKFYLVGNKLFTKSWLTWYMKKFYSTDVKEGYTLHIIDKDVNLFKINEHEFILLTGNKYEICDANN